MKTKIFALILATLCIAMLLVSCGEEAAENNVCTSHVDENKDKKCDNCAVDYVAPCDMLVDTDDDGKCDYCGHEATLPEEIIPEMVVNPIPGDVDVNQYFDFEYVGDDLVVTDKKDMIGSIVANSAINGGRIIIFKHSAEETIDPTKPDFNPNVPSAPVEDPWMKDHYSVYDLVTKETIYSFQSGRYNNEYPLTETYSFTISDYYYGIQKTEITKETGNPFENPIITYTYTYRTNGGDSIVTTRDLNRFEEVEIGDVFYLTVNDLVYPIDKETSKRLTLAGSTEPYVGNVDTFVNRPAFDHVFNDMGYVFESLNGNIVGIQVYDLSKWVDCIYSYTVPSYVEGYYTQIGVLQSSEILLETLIPLAANEKTYDVIEQGIKYDIVYTLINPQTAAEREIEFGYYIASIGEASDSELVKNGEVSPNLAKIYPVVDDMIDFSEAKTVIVDNELNILCELSKILPAQTLATKTPVGNDLYIVKLNIGGDEVDAVVDGTGALKNYLPATSFRGDGFIIAGSKIYSYDMKEKFNLRTLESEYEIEVCERTFLILSKPNISDSELNDYYYFNPAESSQPVLIASDNPATYNRVYLGRLGSSLFLIREDFRLSTDITSPVISKYHVFNSKNIEVDEFSDFLFCVGEYDNTILVSDGTINYLFYKK